MHTPDRENIQNFRVVGINYKKTDASVRGLFAVNNEQYQQLLTLAPQHGLKDLFILSTCNRTEIYGFAYSDNQLTELVCKVTVGDATTFENMGYAKSGFAAIEHLYSVGAGLDSQILGDYEILGQIKAAVKISKSQGFIGAFTERLINSVLQCSKAIKTNTALSGGTVSVSFAAVQYIREYFHGAVGTSARVDHPRPLLKTGGEVLCSTQVVGTSPRPSPKERGTLPVTQVVASVGELPTGDCELPTDGCRYAAGGKKIVLIGTGKIGRATCKNLVDYLGTNNITLINRTEETAVNLAQELGLLSAPMAELDAQLQGADVILVSTNASLPVVLKEHLEGRGKKLVIDLSVPCNVADDAQDLPGVTFVDVDTLSQIKDKTLQARMAEVPKATAIIEEHIQEFKEWHDMRKHVPVLKEVKNKLRGIHIDPLLLSGPVGDDEKIQKVINSLATKMRRDNNAGCNYIQAINDFIA
ncbi:MAG: glutamyl-tRNA reductase [Bacteroidota bacterium]